jgi:hypothetical protein
MKRVVVFATTHAIQDDGHGLNSELRLRLSFLTEKFAPTLLMEEWASDRAPSFASKFASECRISYEDIGPAPADEFKTLGFAPINFPGHNGTLGPCCDAPAFHEYGPLQRQENREQRMVQNIVQAMKDHRIGIFVVGVAHLHSMFTKLRVADFNVAAYSWLG